MFGSTVECAPSAVVYFKLQAKKLRADQSKMGKKIKANIRLDSPEPEIAAVAAQPSGHHNVERTKDVLDAKAEGVISDESASKPKKLSYKEREALIKRNGYVCYLCPEDDTAPYMNHADIRQHIIKVHKGCKDCLSVYPDFEEAETCQDATYICRECHVCIETDVEALQHFAQIHRGQVKPFQARLPVQRKRGRRNELKDQWDLAPLRYCEKCNYFMPRIGTERGHDCPARRPKNVPQGQGKNNFCHICIYRFGDLAAHANATHFPCDDCEQFFALQSTLDNHVAEEHALENAEQQN
ncbi:hypothetical protein QFC20_003689 [Naganishia adeliensis]|uniref:Uncharacterized protein n=1 Tax=Naganishia adeliensis TaxID=92952 RepID=A0ACC2W9A4_9TREE|nr:hypothetical protein QFC20_003689 [Naganishia adeliensis]